MIFKELGFGPSLFLFRENYTAYYERETGSSNGRATDFNLWVIGSNPILALFHFYYPYVGDGKRC